MKTIDIILKAIGSLEGKVDGINKRLDTLNGTVKNHDKRINTNESKIDVMTGKATMIGMIFGFLGACVIALIGFFQK
ncbi:MAG: hypothetical protein ACTSQA_02495 [Candidatus Heimdallarchaeaceae archaeon]